MTLAYALLPHRVVIDSEKSIVVERSLFGKDLARTPLSQFSCVEVVKNDWADSSGNFQCALTLAVTDKACIKLDDGYSEVQAKESAEFLLEFLAESGTKLPLRFKSRRKD